MGLADAHLVEAGRSVVVAVDLQPALLNVMFEKERIIDNARRLLACAAILRVPVIATTQYAEKLGALDERFTELLPDIASVDKMCFSCMGNSHFRAALEGLRGRSQVILAGLETHVCINQTAHDLLDDGYVVHLASDAISSRSEFNYRYGLERLRNVGATVSTVESIVFEWLRKAGTPEFKEVAKWIK
ncbi:MAG: isochorismatase family protein [Armatimonadetes bacterium]|nr:isochorismatase family protein [Armatimonadota bacterium]